MIQTTALNQLHQTKFNNGTHSAIADVPREKGGHGQGFGPHELLEAALATCMSMTARMYADQQQLAVRDIQCRVQVDRTVDGQVTFRYTLTTEGSLTDSQRAELEAAVARCPVARTLSGKILFQPKE